MKNSNLKSILYAMAIGVLFTSCERRDAVQQFTGSTSNTLTLSNAPSAAGMLFITFNGVELSPADYSVSGNIITLANVNRETSDVLIVHY